TGGGFPAIPLKIIYPDIKITLNDSINKKVKVLEEIIRKMNFNNSRAVWARAEDICNDKKYNHKFDIAISKAVTELDKLYLWSREFLKQGGNMLSIKGGDTQKEEKEFHKKFPGKKLTEIKFEFDSGYNIIDKKLIVIN
ncbi:MAG TPA: class I SAM-dependent methyltransferase, partial [Ignavibacteria bacterium]|nr:class I SAM-dependent methyltransferase [Ignavibacteria bacterium]